MVISWSRYFSSSPETPSQVSSQLIHFENVSNKNINFLSQLFENDRMISLFNLKDEYGLTNDMFFQWDQLKHTFPTKWKTLISNYGDTDEKHLCQDHHVSKGARILSTDKLSSKEFSIIFDPNFKHC